MVYINKVLCFSEAENLGFTAIGKKRHLEKTER
jgi:hypothetical protein